MQALILAGGLGTRLRSVLPELPKPLAPIGNKPFLLYLLEQLRNQGIKEVILSVGYRASQIEEVFGDGAAIGLTIQYAREENPMGTGGAIRNALPLLTDEDVMIMNGDTYFAIDYQILVKYHRLWNAGATVALKYQTSALRYGFVNLALQSFALKEIIDLNAQARELYQITSFCEKPATILDDGFINGGVYIVRRDLIADILLRPASLERDILPHWVQRGILYGLPVSGRFIDIGVPEDYHSALKKLDGWVKLPKFRALFLDRDGIINEDFGYVWRKEDIRFIPRTIELIRKANRRGWKVIVVTNQAGVARGYYGEEDVQSLHCWMGGELNKLRAKIDAIYYCPHHPMGIIEPYRKQCLCRKPMPGMVLRAADDEDIDLSKSMIIGDHLTDQIKLPNLRCFIVKP